MNNCLVKKLKGVIADSSLPKLNDLVLSIVAGTGDFKIKVNNRNVVSDTVRLTNGLTFDGGGTEVAYVTNTVLAVDAGVGNMYYPDTNGVTLITADDSGDKTRLASNIDDWYLPSLSQVNFPGCSNLTGDISSFGVSSAFTSANLYETKIYGSIEGLVEKLRQAGKTTGTIWLALGGTTNVTFQGTKVTSGTTYAYTWDAQGNITRS